MAVLSDTQRKEVSAQFQRDLSRIAETIENLTKADIKQAVDDIDGWVDDNTVSFNNSISNPAKSNLTSQQKARLLWYVVKRRFEIGEP